MDIIVFSANKCAQRVEHLAKEIDFQLIWFDFSRQNTTWFQQIKKLLDLEVDEKHILDSLNETHPSFFDGMLNYDMVIFRSLCHNTSIDKLETQPVAFFLFERCLVTIHSDNNYAIPLVKRRILNNNYKTRQLPLHVAGLMHQILDVIVIQFLALREPFSEQLDTWRNEFLLDDDFSDWQSFINHKRQSVKLETLCEQQLDALIAWREEARETLDEHLVVRYNDLIEHIHRVLHHVKTLQNEIEFLIQLQFSAQAQRTNKVILPLTLVSIIFLPLNLIASIFGMNFIDLPLIEHPLGYLYALIGMVTLAVTLLITFKWKRWL